MKIILASASPRRKELLELLNVKFKVIPSTIKEITTKKLPNDIVIDLAKQKANDVKSKVNQDCIIISADTIVVLNNKIMGKPKNQDDAFNMLKALQNNTHSVFTGVYIIIRESNIFTEYNFYEKTDVTMYKISDENIMNYIKTNEPMDKAGSYAIQGIFSVNIKSIKGEYNNVVGLPIAKLYNFLLKKGINLLDYRGK